MKKIVLSPTTSSTVGLYGYGNPGCAASQAWHAMGGQGFVVRKSGVQIPRNPLFVGVSFKWDRQKHHGQLGLKQNRS